MVLTVHGVSLPLVPTPHGPLLATGGEPLEPLAWVLNLALTGALPGFRDAVERGEDAGMRGAALWRPQPGEDLAGAAAAWQAAGGGELGDDLYLASVEHSPGAVAAPRAFVAGAFDELARRRADYQRGEPAIPEETKRALLELEESARERGGPEDDGSWEAELERHGLTAPTAERRAWLERWQLGRLAAWARAAEARRAYATSAARARHLGTPEPAEPPIALGLFIGGDLPGDDFFDWMGFYERAFRDAPSKEGDEGEVFTRAGDRWGRVVWRRWRGRPTITGIELE
jgi:hypothetical protein